MTKTRGAALVLLAMALSACSADPTPQSDDAGGAGASADAGNSSRDACELYCASPPTKTCVASSFDACVTQCEAGYATLSAACVPRLEALHRCYAALQPDQYECDGGAAKFDGAACASQISALAAAGCGGASKDAGAGGAGGSDAGGGLDCSTLGAGCIELCEGGDCSCDCSGAAPCPEQAPTVGAACATSPEICSYGATSMCRSLWQCHADAWVLLEEACYTSSDPPCPATLAQYMSGTCALPRCIYEDATVCACAMPQCSGIPQPEVPVCAPPAPAACRAALVEGAACAPIGQRCGTTCCGLGWDCTADGWHSTQYPCPP